MASCRSLVAALVLASGALAADPPRITVAPESVVAGDPVRLGDVAALEGDAAALASLVVGHAPAAGETRYLDGSTILAAVRRERGGLDDVRYTIPALVRVRRATQEVTETGLRQVLDAFLAETLGAGARDAVVRSIGVAGPVLVPSGSWSARVVLPPNTSLLGHVRLPIELTVDRTPVRTVWVNADIGLYGPVVVPHRPVARGEVLGEGDVVVERRDLSELPRGALVEPADVIGRSARTPLLPFTPIRREQLAATTLVHRGDAVLLVAERGGMRITAAGEAREDAGAGDSVRVMNRASQKTLVGRVLDGSTVAVEF